MTRFEVEIYIPSFHNDLQSSNIYSKFEVAAFALKRCLKMAELPVGFVYCAIAVEGHAQISSLSFMTRWWFYSVVLFEMCKQLDLVHVLDKIADIYPRLKAVSEFKCAIVPKIYVTENLMFVFLLELTYVMTEYQPITSSDNVRNRSGIPCLHAGLTPLDHAGRQCFELA